SDPSVSDDHVWGRARLERLLKDSPGTGAAADENLLIDIRRVVRWWRLSLPTWEKLAEGFYHLNTPYGRFSVRRSMGWAVERYGLPLVWWDTGSRVIFDKLEDAKTSALVHLTDDGGYVRYPDGTRWLDPATSQSACPGTSSIPMAA